MFLTRNQRFSVFTKASALLPVLTMLLLLFPALAGKTAVAKQEGGTIRREVRIVNLYCTVQGKKGKLISDLEGPEFEIFEDGKRQELRHFETETDRPLTLAVLLDTSGSQSGTLPLEKDAVEQFFARVLRSSDLATLISFSTDVDLLQDFTTDLDLLREGLDRAKISAPVGRGPVPGQVAGTRLFDAVYLASREKLGQEVGRKAIIIVSDGFDTGSHTKEKAAIAAAHRSEVIIFSVGIINPRYRSSPRTLRKLANETGGFAVFPRNDEQLLEAFDEIAAQLRTQYLLSYTPTNRASDGKFRKVKVKITRKGLKVRTRRGYYAPGERD